MNDVWELERRLWLEGIDAYSALMARQCLMLFGPMGIMKRESILDSIGKAPRWTSVTFSEKTSVDNGSTLVLAYRAEGTRDPGDAYRALCSSTYVQEDGGWKIMAHQQTPL